MSTNFGFASHQIRSHQVWGMAGGEVAWPRVEWGRKCKEWVPY